MQEGCLVPVPLPVACCSRWALARWPMTSRASRRPWMASIGRSHMATTVATSPWRCNWLLELPWFDPFQRGDCSGSATKAKSWRRWRFVLLGCSAAEVVPGRSASGSLAARTPNSTRREACQPWILREDGNESNPWVSARHNKIRVIFYYAVHFLPLSARALPYRCVYAASRAPIPAPIAITIQMHTVTQ